MASNFKGRMGLSITKSFIMTEEEKAQILIEISRNQLKIFEFSIFKRIFSITFTNIVLI